MPYSNCSLKLQVYSTSNSVGLLKGVTRLLEGPGENKRSVGSDAGEGTLSSAIDE